MELPMLQATTSPPSSIYVGGSAFVPLPYNRQQGHFGFPGHHLPFPGPHAGMLGAPSHAPFPSLESGAVMNPVAVDEDCGRPRSPSDSSSRDSSSTRRRRGGRRKRSRSSSEEDSRSDDDNHRRIHDDNDSGRWRRYRKTTSGSRSNSFSSPERDSSRRRDADSRRPHRDRDSRHRQKNQRAGESGRGEGSRRRGRDYHRWSGEVRYQRPVGARGMSRSKNTTNRHLPPEYNSIWSRKQSTLSATSKQRKQ